MTERVISVDYLARVEGESSLKVRIEGDRLASVELRIFEPPRFFEAFLRGRSYAEAPDITARICGICPVAYQMSACHAMERWLDLTPGPEIRALRRLLYCGEWIESHALHLFLLYLPDFFGSPGAVELARERPELIARGLSIKRAGNRILELLGGREIHPVNVRVGGFYRAPAPEELARLRAPLAGALEEAEETVRFVAGLEFPELEEDYEFVALTNEREYPMNEGIVGSSRGLSLPADRFEEEFEEFQVPYSNALMVRRRGGGSYLVGPLARYALNAGRLGPRARAVAKEVGLEPRVRNPFRGGIVRAVEIVFALEEALRLIDGYRPPEPPAAEPPAALPAGEGAAITEAPRGMLFHRYRLSAGGLIDEARIVAPTTQNQLRIEDDLRDLVGRSLSLDEARLTLACERAIRNHDPCISCATHFLSLKLERGGP